MDIIRNKIYLLHHELTEALFSQNSAETNFEDQTAGNHMKVVLYKVEQKKWS